ncbi:MAG TPA: DUF2207 domain-containing protein [Gemmatimonadaceae bacterium]|nr:DUF2207 domain-containing protein [Gemmatimonadaceae bacterium]
MKRAALALAMMLLAFPASAQERIRAYDVDVDVRADGSLDVTERITVHAEGQQIRRGIYRDFPTRYRDRYGNRVRVALDVIGVERDGNPEPWFTERMSNGVRINTGNDDFLPVPAGYTYTLRYRTTRQLGFFDNHDELYWNAIGTGWIFPIESATVQVRLPAAVPIDRMTAEAYTGPQGARGANYVAELTRPGVATYRLTQPLGPNEGFTTVLQFPKGLIAAPTEGDRARWFLADNRGVLVGLLGLVLLILFCVREWRRVGRDPKKRAIFARYEPPADKTAAGLRFVQRMGYDTRCFSAEVLDLAVGGQLRINRDKKLLKDSWRLDRNESVSAPASAADSVLLTLLFPDGRKTLKLKNTNAAIVSAAQDAHKKELDREFHPRYFQRNTRSLVIATAIALVAAAAAFVISGGFGIPVIVAIVVAMVLTLIVFGRLVRAPTREGRELMDEIEGLKLYLSVAERDELASMRGPGQPPMLDAERYEALLPYAVALEVEEAWTEKFTAAVGAAAAAEAASRMSWYSGRGPITNLGDFSKSMGSSLSSQISSASSPPGSSSGGGGGGSSGGGGGGGGGGGR